MQSAAYHKTKVKVHLTELWWCFGWWVQANIWAIIVTITAVKSKNTGWTPVNVMYKQVTLSIQTEALNIIKRELDDISICPRLVF